MAKLDKQILEILQQSEGHMTADDLFLHCRQNGVSASHASVYRVLSKLASEGKIQRVPIPGKPDVFDKTTVPHEHLICSECGALQDFSIDGLAELIAHATGIMPDAFVLSATYVCDACKTT